MNEKLRNMGYTDEQIAAVSASIKMTINGAPFSVPVGETAKDAYERIDAHAIFKAGAHQAQWWRKIASVRARPALMGEEVATVVDGKVETANAALADDMLAQNPGGERYLVPQSKFIVKYELISEAADEEGFRVYRSTSSPVACVCVDRDIEFVAPWGELMRIARGGYLVNGGGDDVYGVQRAAFLSTYSRCYPDGRELSVDVWQAAYSDACVEARDDFQQSRTRLTDAQVEARALRSIDATLVGLH